MISKKKISFPVTPPLREYLRKYQREVKLPVSYQHLKHFNESIPLFDKNGSDTLWETPLYPHDYLSEINEGLKYIYAMLKAGGDKWVQRHLYIERIDYCTFANSNPFRVKIVNSYNDVHDYFYIKIADASRIYGLELEHILSPNQLFFLTHENTLVEEHIAGIPGDIFLPMFRDREEFNPKRLAKEFVKFNERCFVRLLGDMRSYNFVLDITPDFDDYQFRIRAIDFDQQFYEGNIKVYLPQFFKENLPYVELVMQYFNKEVVLQYQKEERSLIARRVREQRQRLRRLRDVLMQDNVSTPEKIIQLGNDLAEYYKDPAFLKSRGMGDIIDRSLKMVLKDSIIKRSD